MTWTLDEVCEANVTTAERWAQARNDGDHLQQRRYRDDWLWIIYVQRLCWLYEPEGALARLNEGRRAAA